MRLKRRVINALEGSAGGRDDESASSNEACFSFLSRLVHIGR
jgi:hypothetical protein